MAFFASAIGEEKSELASDHQLKVLVTAEQRIIKRRATQQSGSVGPLFCNARGLGDGRGDKGPLD